MAEQKGKFKNLIGQMKEQATQESGKPDNQTTDVVEATSEALDQTTRQPDLVNPVENQTTSLPDTQTSIKPDAQTASQPDEVKRVNLCVKVPEHWRKHWAIQARVHDTTMTEVMIEALTARFGLPDDQTTR